VTEVTSDLRVHPRHVRSAKLCLRGARDFFARYDLDYGSFLSDGVPASVLEGIGDPLGLRAVTAAREEAGTDG
jgi:hypothetical protein